MIHLFVRRVTVATMWIHRHCERTILATETDSVSLCARLAQVGSKLKRTKTCSTTCFNKSQRPWEIRVVASRLRSVLFPAWLSAKSFVPQSLRNALLVGGQKWVCRCVFVCVGREESQPRPTLSKLAANECRLGGGVTWLPEDILPAFHGKKPSKRCDPSVVVVVVAVFHQKKKDCIVPSCVYDEKQ